MGAIKGHPVSKETRQKISLAATRLGETHQSQRRGDPCINLCLAVLSFAKQSNSKMWLDFKKEHHMSRCFYGNLLDVALWVGDFWERNKNNPHYGEPFQENLYGKAHRGN